MFADLGRQVQKVLSRHGGRIAVVVPRRSQVAMAPKVADEHDVASPWPGAITHGWSTLLSRRTVGNTGSAS